LEDFIVEGEIKAPEAYLEEMLKGISISSVLDVGTGPPGIFHYHWWQSKPLNLKVCLDIKQIREDIEGWEKVIADARCLPFRDKSLDHIQATEMLEHVPRKDHRKILRELKRVARKTVFVTSSGLKKHLGQSQRELEAVNPFQKYQGIVDRKLLEEEGFEILFYWKKGNLEENVKAFLRF